MYFEHILKRKMDNFIKCTNGFKDRLTVPLSEDNNDLVCALCDYRVLQGNEENQ